MVQETPKMLFVFPDTNVFLQCKPLEQVAWSLLGDFERIEVVLTRPVQSEIDSFKGKGNGRQASRARAASARVGELFETDAGHLVLRASNPAVCLSFRHDLRRDESAATELNDYEERDDQLVGLALAFAKKNSDSQVALLTNDIGPRASAKAVGLRCIRVPEGWLLPPEADESDKRVKALKAELAKYQASEPAFSLTFPTLAEQRINTVVTVYAEPTGHEIELLLKRLYDRHPLATGFGPTETQQRVPEHNAFEALIGSAKEVFEPATQEEIRDYRTAYSEWERESAEKLRNLHKSLNRQAEFPAIRVSVVNNGSRPAEDTLVVFEVQGNTLICAPKRAQQEGHPKDAARAALEMAPPPRAPKGRWKRVDPLGMLQQLTALRGSDIDWMPKSVLTPLANFIAPSIVDPNALYLKVGSRGHPSKRIEFDCMQWRHAQPARDIDLSILAPPRAGQYSSLLTVTVHAANLTEPVIARMPMELTIQEASCIALAEQMVAACG